MESMDVETFFNQEVTGWRSKMIKIYGDQHPYIFFVTAGHDFEDFILKVEDSKVTEREFKRSEPFENLEQMKEVDEKAVKEFSELLDNMAQQKATPELKEVLEEKKIECSRVFAMFDEIVALCEKYFELEFTNCRNRVSKQLSLQEPIIKEVEKFLDEVEEVGNSEVRSLRERISSFVYNKGFSKLNYIENAYSTLNKEPLAMSTWFDCVAELTSKEIRSAFLSEQKDLSLLWKKSYDDLLMLSTKLEKCRCNYNMTKFKLERESFWMSRDYKEKMPELTKNQRCLSGLVDQKVSLKSELKSLDIEIQLEHRNLEGTKEKLFKKIISTKNSNKLAHQTSVKKFQIIIQIKMEEIYNYLTEIIEGDKFIHQKVLGKKWDPVDVSHLKPVNAEKDCSSISLSTSENLETEINHPKSVHCDKFSDAFQLLISSDHFISLLNAVSDQLGYILDFTWVDYVHKKLNLVREVKWLELFKVFKIDFVDDLKELKEKMMPYCKFSENGDVVFDINGAIDGFLNFIWLKRQSSANKVSDCEYNAEDYAEYWDAASNLIPKSLLWESVEEVLESYWKLLEERSVLMQKNMSLAEENRELENCLENFHKYGTWCVT